MVTILADQDFKNGIKDSGPICIAFIFICMSFGGLSRSSGLSFMQTIIMELCVYSIPLQVIMLKMNLGKLGIIAVAALSLMINARFSLMTLSILPYFKGKEIKKIIPSLCMLSASSFTVAHVKFTTKQLQDPWNYFLGVASASYITAFLTTTIGFYLMDATQLSILTHVFSLAIGIHFTALTALRWPQLKLMLSTLLGFLLMPMINLFASTNLSIIIVPLLAGFVVLLLSIGFKKL